MEEKYNGKEISRHGGSEIRKLRKVDFKGV